MIEDVKYPIYADGSGDSINCDVKFDTFVSYLPYTAYKYDVVQQSRDLYAALVAGDWGPISPYIPPPPAVVVEQDGPNIVA